MELDTLYKQQSEQDLKSACVLYNIGDYGNAVFLAQQALEKAFKYVMMKCNLADQCAKSLKDLTHKPEVALIRKLKKYNVDFIPKNDAEAKVKSTVGNTLPLLEGFFKKPDKSVIPYQNWWKISLGMKLPPEEEDKIWVYISRRLNGMMCDLKEIKNIALKINNGKSKRISQILDEINKALKAPQDISKNISKRPTRIKHSKVQAEIENALCDLFPVISKNVKQPDKRIIGILALSRWLIIHNLILLKIAPHQQLGRYPEKIDGVRSTVHYRRHAKQLSTLIGEVDSAVKRLYSI